MPFRKTLHSHTSTLEKKLSSHINEGREFGEFAYTNRYETVDNAAHSVGFKMYQGKLVMKNYNGQYHTNGIDTDEVNSLCNISLDGSTSPKKESKLYDWSWGSLTCNHTQRKS